MEAAEQAIHDAEALLEQGAVDHARLQAEAVAAAKAFEAAKLPFSLALDPVVGFAADWAGPEAREALMARDWPAKDMAPLIVLIADPRHTLTAEGTYRLSDEQARAILDLRLQRLTALGRDEIAEELQKLA